MREHIIMLTAPNREQLEAMVEQHREMGYQPSKPPFSCDNGRMCQMVERRVRQRHDPKGHNPRNLCPSC